jgi:hypothetical protein
MRQVAKQVRRVPYGALVMLERSAGKLARSVLRGLGGREPTWLPGGASFHPPFQGGGGQWGGMRLSRGGLAMDQAIEFAVGFMERVVQEENNDRKVEI